MLDRQTLLQKHSQRQQNYFLPVLFHKSTPNTPVMPDKESMQNFDRWYHNLATNNDGQMILS